MAFNLVDRAGIDTLEKLEAAARLRWQEARVLDTQGWRLGAIYLYGYSVEIRLKAAYYRLIGLTASTPIDRVTHRLPAEDAIRRMPSLPSHPGGRPAPGHDVAGWAQLLEEERLRRGIRLSASLSRELHAHAKLIFSCWAEMLRYRANRPYNVELEAGRVAAHWFKAHGTRLWR